MKRQMPAAARLVQETVQKKSVPTISHREECIYRIKLTTLYKIDDIMNGDLQELLDALITADRSAKLAKMNEMNG